MEEEVVWTNISRCANIYFVTDLHGARNGAICWGRGFDSFECFIDTILQTTLWP